MSVHARVWQVQPNAPVDRLVFIGDFPSLPRKGEIMVIGEDMFDVSLVEWTCPREDEPTATIYVYWQGRRAS